MIYPNITIDDLKKWCAIGGEDGSQHVPGKKIILDEDEHCFGKLLSLLDLQITKNTSRERLQKNKSMSKKEINAYYQGRIDQIIEALANGIFSDATALDMAVSTAQFENLFSANPKDIPYAIQYMLRLNGYAIDKECSVYTYLQDKPTEHPIRIADEIWQYGQTLDEAQMKKSLEEQQITGLPSNVEYMINLGRSETQKGAE